MVKNSFFISLAKAVVVIIVAHFVIIRLLSNRTVASRKVVQITDSLPSVGQQNNNPLISKQDINSRLIDFVEDIDADSDSSSDLDFYEPETHSTLKDRNFTPYRPGEDVADLKKLIHNSASEQSSNIPVSGLSPVASRSEPEPVCTGGQFMEGVHGYNFDNSDIGFSLVESPPQTFSVAPVVST